MSEQFVYPQVADLQPQVADLQPQVIFQHDGAPPHWSRMFRIPSQNLSQIPGLDAADQFAGHHIRQTSLHWTSSSGDM